MLSSIHYAISQSEVHFGTMVRENNKYTPLMLKTKSIKITKLFNFY